jgi:hypothetical protein
MHHWSYLRLRFSRRKNSNEGSLVERGIEDPELKGGGAPEALLVGGEKGKRGGGFGGGFCISRRLVAAIFS